MGRIWRVLVAYPLGLLAAAILAIAAFYKAGDLPLFADQITAHQVTPEAWSPFLAYFFVLVELLAAAALVAFVWPRLAFAGTVLLMLGFIGVTAWAWAHGNVEECGCFGRLIDRGPQEVILEDTIIVLTSLVGFSLIGRFRTRLWQWAIAVPLMVLAVVLAIFGTALPLDGAIVGIGPGTDLSEMALQGVRFPIDEGWVLLALVGPECPACEEGIAALKQVVSRKMGPRVLAAHPGPPAQAQSWRLKYLPNFPVASCPERVLRQYYRNLPVTFLIEDGTLRKVWWNRIPAPDDISQALQSVLWKDDWGKRRRRLGGQILTGGDCSRSPRLLAQR